MGWYNIVCEFWVVVYLCVGLLRVFGRPGLGVRWAGWCASPFVVLVWVWVGLILVVLACFVVIWCCVLRFGWVCDGELVVFLICGGLWVCGELVLWFCECGNGNTFGDWEIVLLCAILVGLV